MHESNTIKTIPLTIPEPEVEKTNPWSDDRLGVKSFADMLTSIVENQNRPLTLAVNGAWGSGKSFLLKRWHQDLLNQGFASAYFSAWEDDDQADPLLSLLWRLVHANDQKSKSGEGVLSQPAVRDSFELACNYLRSRKVLAPENLALTTASFIGAATTAMLPGQSVWCRLLGKLFLKSLKKANKATEIFAEYENRSHSKEKLANSFKKMVASIIVKDGMILHRPVIIIIDELDRCRPLYAIEMLERIKHLFALENIVFVLGIDREQLGRSIKAVYGEIDVVNYLHRFFDVELTLPVEKSSPFIEALWNQFGFSSFVQESSPDYMKRDRQKRGDMDFMKMIQELAIIHRMSLREIERFVTYYVLVLREKKDNECYRYPLALVLIFLKLRAPDLYFSLVQGTAKLVDVADCLIPDISPKSDEYQIIGILGIVYAIFKFHCGSSGDQAAVGVYLEQIVGTEHLYGANEENNGEGNGQEQWEAKSLKKLQRTLSELPVAVKEAEKEIFGHDRSHVTHTVPQCIREVAQCLDFIDRS